MYFISTLTTHIRLLICHLITKLPVIFCQNIILHLWCKKVVNIQSRINKLCRNIVKCTLYNCTNEVNCATNMYIVQYIPYCLYWKARKIYIYIYIMCLQLVGFWVSFLLPLFSFKIWREEQIIFKFSST